MLGPQPPLPAGRSKGSLLPTTLQCPTLPVFPLYMFFVWTGLNLPDRGGEQPGDIQSGC